MFTRNKLYYPKSHITTNLRTDGKEWMFEDGTEFKGFYHKYIDGTVLSGAVFHKTDSKKLIPYIDKVTQPNNVEYDALIKRPIIKSPYYIFPIPKLEDYEVGKITRYFIRRRNDVNPSNIMEIDKDQFLSWKKPNFGIDSTLYIATEVEWKLTGPRFDDRSSVNIIYGVEDTNRRIVELKDDEYPGMKNFLTNHIELSIHSDYVSPDIKKLFG
jgi:hypothetical protein